MAVPGLNLSEGDGLLDGVRSRSVGESVRTRMILKSVVYGSDRLTTDD